jgi:hypothetical protein
MEHTRSATTNRDLWYGMKMLLVVAIGMFVVANIIYAIQGYHLGTGGIGNSHVVEGGQIVDGPRATIYHNGFWSDTWKIVLLVVVDAGLILFWYRLISKIKSV